MTRETGPGPIRDAALGRTPAPVRPMGAVADLAQASMAPSTRRSYGASLRGFERSGYPETDAGVAAYLGDLYEEGRTVSGATGVISALRFRAKLNGRPSPVGPATQRVLAGFRRLASERGYGQVAGVRWEQADRARHWPKARGVRAGCETPRSWRWRATRCSGWARSRLWTSAT